MRLGLLAEHDNLSIFSPAGPPGQSISDLFILVIVITSAIFLLVEGVLIYNLLRCKQVSNPSAIHQPPQVYGSVAIEIAWTAAPLLIVFVLALLVARSLWDVRVDPSYPPPGSRPVYVTVIGHQWWWEYHHDTSDGKDLNFTTANELHLPTSEPGIVRPIYLNLQSADVNHSFWIPRLQGKTDMVPAHNNVMWVQTDEPGLYLGQCSEYCGVAHARMLLRVYFEPLEQFESWVAAQQKPAVDDSAVQAGRDMFLSLSCANCHTIRGTVAKGIYGPDLTHLMSRETIGSGILPNNSHTLSDWVQNSHRLKPGCLMPEFKLTDHDLDLMVRYLTTLK